LKNIEQILVAETGQDENELKQAGCGKFFTDRMTGSRIWLSSGI